MKNKYILISCVALLAILLNACAGAAAETSPQLGENQSSSGGDVDWIANGAAQDGHGERDLTAAAAALGVTVEVLQQALQGAVPADCASGTPNVGGRSKCNPDLNLAAQTLGVTVEELQAALEIGQQGERRERDLTAAAETLGITVEALQQAIQNARPAACPADGGQPTQGLDCRPDLNIVAAALGVTVEELEAALGKWPKDGRGDSGQAP
jgi:hypothetical protein